MLLEDHPTDNFDTPMGPFIPLSDVEADEDEATGGSSDSDDSDLDVQLLNFSELSSPFRFYARHTTYKSHLRSFIFKPPSFLSFRHSFISCSPCSPSLLLSH